MTSRSVRSTLLHPPRWLVGSPPQPHFEPRTCLRNSSHYESSFSRPMRGAKGDRQPSKRPGLCRGSKKGLGRFSSSAFHPCSDVSSTEAPGASEMVLLGSPTRAPPSQPQPPLEGQRWSFRGQTQSLLAALPTIPLDRTQKKEKVSQRLGRRHLFRFCYINSYGKLGGLKGAAAVSLCTLRPPRSPWGREWGGGLGMTGGDRNSGRYLS